MVLSKAQETEFKNLCKEVVKELLSDKDFMESFCDKVVAVVTKKLSADSDKFKKQLNTLESKLTKMQGDHKTLKEENEVLRNKLKEATQSSNVQSDGLLYKLDDLEQHSKMHLLRVFGIPEVKDENLNAILVDFFAKNLEVTDCQIEYCYRIGSAGKKSKKPRPIAVKFINMIDRNNVFYNKKKLKGKQIFIAEELTNIRYKLLHLTVDEFGKDCVWTRGGKIFANIRGKKYCVKTNEDLEQLVK